VNRKSFGSWGIDLSDDEFAKALAALGVLRGRSSRGWQSFTKSTDVHAALKRHALVERNILAWNVSSNSRQSILSGAPAALFAKAWDLFRGGFNPYVNPLRIEIESTEQDDPLWLIEQLCREAVGARSVYVRADHPGGDAGWNWPLRVGFFTDETSQGLRQRITESIGEHDWLGKLVDFANVTSDDDKCDLLLVPHTPRRALAALLELQTPVRADCIIVLEQSRETAQRTFAAIEAIRALAHTSGVVMAPINDHCRADWFRDLIRELSHNNTFDVSVFVACRWFRLQSPILYVARRLILFSPLSRFMDALGQRMTRSKAKTRSINVPTRTAMRIALEAGDYSMKSLGDHLQNTKSAAFISESDMATGAVELADLAGPTLERAPPPPQPRYIQADVYGGNNLKAREYNGFSRGATYAVDFYIGARTRNSISPDVRFPFPVEKLPPSDDGHQIRVVFSEPNFLPRPQVETIFLPRHGNSKKCRFNLFINREIAADNFEGRVIFLHENRVLQTAQLTAPIFDGEPGHPDSKIRLEMEAIVRLRTEDLGDAHRRPFRAAILINRGTDGTPRATKIIGEDAELISLDGIEDNVRWIEDKISSIVNRPDSYARMDSEASTALLRGLAQNGSVIYETFTQGEPLKNPLAKARRVQVVSAKIGARFPAEFLYDRGAPQDDTRLCSNAEQALRDGTCPHTCPAGEGQRTVICPLGFWGLSRVIERHVHDKDFTEKLKGNDFALQPETFAGRVKLNVLTDALLAASKHVDAEVPGSVDKVSEALKSTVRGKWEVVPSWQEWRKQVATISPSLLVIIPHTLVDRRNNNQRLEIGTDDQLNLSQLYKEYIQGPGGVPPMVLLLGCKTGAPDIPYQNFPMRFRQYGAALVVSSGATILGQHAAPVAAEFLRTLANLPKRGELSFGEVMLEVRRKMLADGILMVLSLTAYGDTDWLV
jgi:hypothetical protein